VPHGFEGRGEEKNQGMSLAEVGKFVGDLEQSVRRGVFMVGSLLRRAQAGRCRRVLSTVSRVRGMVVVHA